MGAGFGMLLKDVAAVVDGAALELGPATGSLDDGADDSDEVDEVEAPVEWAVDVKEDGPATGPPSVLLRGSFVTGMCVGVGAGFRGVLCTAPALGVEGSFEWADAAAAAAAAAALSLVVLVPGAGGGGGSMRVVCLSLFFSVSAPVAGTAVTTRAAVGLAGVGIALMDIDVAGRGRSTDLPAFAPRPLPL